MSDRTEADPAGPGGRTHYLVSCVRRKSPAPAPAKELYTSDWFRKAREYVERTGQPWSILSAKHGLLHPETVIEPYDKTLRTMPIDQRRGWAQRVLVDIERGLGDAESVVLLTSRRYREFLEPALRERGFDVHVPMKGLRIGEQLAWLKRQLSP